MMKNILIITTASICLTGSVQAAGEMTNLDGAAMDKISTGNFKIGIMSESDYGIGVTMQFGHLLDVKVGHQGGGADFHFWHMKLNTDSAYMNRHPLEFYASAGLGYRWEKGGQGNGLIVRAPGGADWQFTTKHWSCYLEIAPSYNFGDNNGFNLMSGTGVRYNF